LNEFGRSKAFSNLRGAKELHRARKHHPTKGKLNHCVCNGETSMVT